ncbi:MAG: hypothetical protein QF652_05680, partial [Dehalococcoidia bacterium]|nr:hypothetical protein [Dehalococcoidia bacterium]
VCGLKERDGATDVIGCRTLTCQLSAHRFGRGQSGCVIGGGVAEGGATRRVVEAFTESRIRAGRQTEIGGALSFGFQFYIADSQEEAMAAAGKYYEENLKMFGPLRLIRALSEEQIEIMSDPKQAPTADLPHIEDAVATGGFLAGPPDQIIEQLKAVEGWYPGLDRIMVS